MFLFALRKNASNIHINCGKKKKLKKKSRLLPAFDTSNNIPYAWVNLKYGVLPRETRDTCTAGVGTLLVEFSMLSYYTQNEKYFIKAHKALLSLWNMRNKHYNLIGNSFGGQKLNWHNPNAGIGAGIDSFYEYLIKSYLLIGDEYYWNMFQSAYRSAVTYLR